MARSTSDIYDELLVLRCQRGDNAAWNELVQRYTDRLWYFVRRLIEDDDHAAQVLQEVWLQVLRGLSALRKADRLAPWLYTVARRAAMNHYREQYAAPSRESEPDLDQIVDDEPSGADQFENAELVHFGLRQLGRTEREVLTLFFLQDLSLGEIAAVLEIPVGTVKSRLSRARRELRCLLNTEPRGAEETPHVP